MECLRLMYLREYPLSFQKIKFLKKDNLRLRSIAHLKLRLFPKFQAISKEIRYLKKDNSRFKNTKCLK
jgi:hypothetical protein